MSDDNDVDYESFPVNEEKTIKYVSHSLYEILKSQNAELIAALKSISSEVHIIEGKKYKSLGAQKAEAALSKIKKENL